MTLIFVCICLKDVAAITESSSRPLSAVFQNIHPSSLWKSRKGHLSFNQVSHNLWIYIYIEIIPKYLFALSVDTFSHWSNLINLNCLITRHFSHLLYKWHGYDALSSHFSKKLSAKNIFNAVRLEFGDEGV